MDSIYHELQSLTLTSFASGSSSDSDNSQSHPIFSPRRPSFSRTRGHSSRANSRSPRTLRSLSEPKRIRRRRNHVSPPQCLESESDILKGLGLEKLCSTAMQMQNIDDSSTPAVLHLNDSENNRTTSLRQQNPVDQQNRRLSRFDGASPQCRSRPAPHRGIRYRPYSLPNIFLSSRRRQLVSQASSNISSNAQSVANMKHQFQTYHQIVSVRQLQRCCATLPHDSAALIDQGDSAAITCLASSVRSRLAQPQQCALVERRAREQQQQQAAARGSDNVSATASVSVDELAAYLDDYLYLPRKMSFMAENMYA